MRTSDFDYELPEELIAQTPALNRQDSRLLVLPRNGDELQHRRFHELPSFLRPGDLLILNNSRVIPARVRGVKEASGGQVEFLLHEEVDLNVWWTMARPAKRLHPDTMIRLLNLRQEPSPWRLKSLEKNSDGHLKAQAFHDTDPSARLLDQLDSIGEWPLPPYIQRAGSGQDPRDDLDSERYQTVYAKEAGSVAAPTAGLHFTPELLDGIRVMGVEIGYVTLHVGVGTFAPVKSETLEGHTMHEERFEISGETLDRIRSAKVEGRRVIAVGTTSMRTLESVTEQQLNEVGQAGLRGRTKIFIYPPHDFRWVDGLITNFHLPQSTLLMLVSAFMKPGEKDLGREQVLAAYREAVSQGYRFFSYGDAMFIS